MRATIVRYVVKIYILQTYNTLCGEHMPEEEKKQLVTSLRIDSDLWKEAKVQAIRHDITLTELVEEAINLWLQEKVTENNQSKKK